MTTAYDLVCSALEIAGIISIGEIPAATDSKRGLEILNDLIELWNLDSVTIYKVENTTFDLTPNKQIYTMGIGGDFNVARARIEEATISNTEGFKFCSLSLLDYDQYSALLFTNFKGSYPIALYDDNAFPLKNITLYPTPTTEEYKITLWHWMQFARVDSLADELILPPAYGGAIKYNLACQYAVWFNSPRLNPKAVSLAAQYLTKIRSMNPLPLQAKMDPLYVSAMIGSYYDSCGLPYPYY